MSSAVLERSVTASAQAGIVDCDVHPAFSSPAELMGFLPERWRSHLATFGARQTQPFVGIIPYPRMTTGNGARGDAWPPNGGPPASDLAFFQRHHLDAYNIAFGVLQPLAAGSGTMDQGLGSAMCRGVNEWQIAKWLEPEPRLRGSICVTQEDPDAAVAEIERLAGDRRFVQVAIPPRSIEPIGRRRYWRILEAAAHHGLPIGMHSAAYGPHANSPTGWLSFYIEEHYCFAHSLQTVVTSLIMEGVFERIPDLKLVCIEGGFAWVPPLAWRMDRQWERMRVEVPHVRRKPSEYMAEHIWYTTQPIEEPERPEDMFDLIRWVGADRLMFSTDYPHWDFDDPNYAFKVKVPEAAAEAIFGGNARRLYRLE
jgi:predicted TIM-barrel fold metal-dependent hydrolase